jgi:hypothetical protein
MQQQDGRSIPIMAQTLFHLRDGDTWQSSRLEITKFTQYPLKSDG